MSSLRLTRQAERLRKFDRYFGKPSIDEEASGSFEGWFLGPKAENEEILTQLILEAIRKHCEYRRAYRPDDPTFITAETKHWPEYCAAVERLRRCAAEMLEKLQLSVPIASMRSQGHMLWDQVLPGMVGYFGAMLYNQNNVAAEASPYTTWLEIVVGYDLCRMLGFRVLGESPIRGEITAWGHITCDGSVANIEALWAARNIKFYTLALREALENDPALEAAKTLEVRLLNGSMARLLDLDKWTLLNLPIDNVVSLPETISGKFHVDFNAIEKAVSKYAVQNLGLLEFYRKLLKDFKPPVAFAPQTAHYSWPKAASLLGLGRKQLRGVSVDLQARMDLGDLRRQLEKSLKEGEPVIAVVAVVGSTEENAIDPLREVLDMREELRNRGMDFAIHADAAWGGYFASVLRPDAKGLVPIPTANLSSYVEREIKALADADSVTVDPHKSGYIPYPAGGLCYRNSALRAIVSFKSPVVFHGESDPTVGIYGVEGSKPGAAAAAVYLAHRVIRPTHGGYGKILRQCIWTSKRMYCRLATLTDTRVKLVCLQMLPAERRGECEHAVEEQKRYIRQNFVFRSNEELKELLTTDQNALDLFDELGSDGVILTFSFNFFDPQTGLLNKDVHKLNQLNQKIFEICSLSYLPSSPADLNKLPLILTSSSFSAAYGQQFIDHYCKRLGVEPESGQEVNFLISTTMDPWTTDTSRGDFLGVIEQTLRDAAYRALDELQRRTI